uniref:Kinesin-like protein n=2 Tax=Babesia bovis TaxID=5865 RepID=A7AUW4_BABBO|eukprot:XP_001610293.1 kinesin-like protein [Babesia bovis T2Bo]
MTVAPMHKSRIDVIVRKRPLNELEITRGDTDVVLCNDTAAIIEEPKLRIDGTSYIERYEFCVDRVYDEHADNHTVYNDYVKPLVELAFKQKKTCSCFTYGQTGSGKTFTMIGSRQLKTFKHDYMPGIYEYAANDIYQMLQKPEYEGNLDVVISFYDIYCGKLYDLLQDRKPLEALDNGKREVIIKDLSVIQMKSKEDLMSHMLRGLALRKIGQNSQNSQSSRSHAVLRIELREKLTSKNSGSIAFIDLAGSERGADCINQPKQTQMDGAGINRSLLALKECIRSMDMNKAHIPFRDCELTKVLRDIFVGESRSLMIANICPSSSSCEQTLNTLRYASRVKNFKQSQTHSNTSVLYNPGYTNARKPRASAPNSGITKTHKSKLTAPSTAVSLSLNAKVKNSGITTSSMQASQKIGKSTDSIDFIGKPLVIRNMCPTLSSLCSDISGREHNILPRDRKRASRLPNPFQRLDSSINLQSSAGNNVDIVMDDIELNDENQRLYTSVCDSLDYVIDHFYDYTASNDDEERAFQALKRAEELNNRALLMVMSSNFDRDSRDYIDFLINKFKMQMKPLLFLKQAIEQHKQTITAESKISHNNDPLLNE